MFVRTCVCLANASVLIYLITFCVQRRISQAPFTVNIYRNKGTISTQNRVFTSIVKFSHSRSHPQKLLLFGLLCSQRTCVVNLNSFPDDHDAASFACAPCLFWRQGERVCAARKNFVGVYVTHHKYWW